MRYLVEDARRPHPAVVLVHGGGGDRTELLGDASRSPGAASSR